MEPVFGAQLAAAERDDAPRADARAAVRVRGAGAGGALDRAGLGRTAASQPRHVDAARVLRGRRRAATTVMPGGLTRVADARDSLVVSMQRGGGSKDTWVLADGPVPAFTLLPRPGDERSSSRAAAASCRAASPTTSSGSAATSSAPRAPCASSAPSSARLASESDPADSPGLPALLDALAADAELPQGLALPDDAPNAGALERALGEFARADEPERALRPTLAAAHRLAADRARSHLARHVARADRARARARRRSPRRRGRRAARRSTCSTASSSPSRPSAGSPSRA